MSCLVLVLASLAYTFAEHRSQHATMMSSARALTRVLVLNAAATILVDDSETAGELLGALVELPDVLAGRILKSDGTLVATYTKPGADPDTLCEIAETSFDPGAAPISRFLDRHLAVSQEILAGQRSVGFIDHLAPLAASTTRQLYIVAWVLPIGLLVAFLLASALQRFLSKPLMSLMSTMTQVSRDGHYSMRARAFGPDELGTLTRGFNGMLEQIQRRDEALAQAMIDLKTAKEAAESASAAKSSFLATMSHEIRTPISGVLAMTELLLDSPLTSSQRRLAQSAHRSVVNLLALINDILDFSQARGRLPALGQCTAAGTMRAPVKQSRDVLSSW